MANAVIARSKVRQGAPMKHTFVIGAIIFVLVCLAIVFVKNLYVSEKEGLKIMRDMWEINASFEEPVCVEKLPRINWTWGDNFPSKRKE